MIDLEYGDVCHWHKADMREPLINVCYLGVK